MKSRSEFRYKEEYLNYLRDYYAGLAMQGLLSIYDSTGDRVVPNLSNSIYMAELSVKAADALINELNKETT